jgi:hypothetical protein
LSFGQGVSAQRGRKRGEILAELRRLVTDSALTDTAFREQDCWFVESLCITWSGLSTPGRSGLIVGAGVMKKS